MPQRAPGITHSVCLAAALAAHRAPQDSKVRSPVVLDLFSVIRFIEANPKCFYTTETTLQTKQESARIHV